MPILNTNQISRLGTTTIKHTGTVIYCHCYHTPISKCNKLPGATYIGACSQLSLTSIDITRCPLSRDRICVSVRHHQIEIQFINNTRSGNPNFSVVDKRAGRVIPASIPVYQGGQISRKRGRGNKARIRKEPALGLT